MLQYHEMFSAIYTVYKFSRDENYIGNLNLCICEIGGVWSTSIYRIAQNFDGGKV